MTQYQIAKNMLKCVVLAARSEYKDDKPAVRAIINDTVDEIVRDLNLSEYQSELLSNYACSLHPKT